MANLKFLPLLIFSIIFFFSIQSHASESLIEQTCKNTPHESLCLQYMKSDPGSSQADVTGLALIMVDAIKATAQQAQTKIQQELEKGHGSETEKRALNSCAERYRAVVEGDVPEAIEALQKGDPKFAEQGANDAALEATSCETSFSSGKSPLTQQNNAVHDVAQVAAAIVTNLL
ncbi:cell wall / vacuolar inhibitor of fructosidase 1-like [Senna tora]|uniref:Cell wall / vacuolar inhibitor of fructosidase 1-like n=1 Tax=Senna tora TaxID=362788 RepID=A0A835CG80_9FABA|nr:cell wall / vacuolar inhibitor of fructosidase 1-like [Senna tora]